MNVNVVLELIVLVKYDPALQLIVLTPMLTDSRVIPPVRCAPLPNSTALGNVSAVPNVGAVVNVNVPVTFPLSTGLFKVGVFSVLLVSVCVSVVPTNAPEGAVTAVKGPVPLPFKIPVRVDAPVPPLLTTSVPPMVMVPELVTGDPVTVNPVVPPESPTDVTVPPAAVDAIVMLPAPLVTVMPVPAVSVPSA